MNPYRELPEVHFWNNQVGSNSLSEIDYDPNPKYKFDIERDVFATAGSCFAQHFAQQLMERGGQYYIGEPQHPIIRFDDNGHGVFSGRYGNIYTTRQLKELLEQAVGKRDVIHEIAFRKKDTRYVDMLRPNAVPHGFTSRLETKWDRGFHLKKVIEIIRKSTVFVFTLGLTEYWENVNGNYAYPLCPGVAAGEFDANNHRFKNDGYEQSLLHLRQAIELIHRINKEIKILLTVSPVMLVATYENRGAIQSSVVSKSILRAVADTCFREYSYVDYFPSYEIITGSQSQGLFFREGARDVSPDGVSCVMDYFFKSRFDINSENTDLNKVSALRDYETETAKIKEAFQVECDEILLGRK